MSLRLETERLVLRPPEARDVPALTEFYVSERSRYAGGNVPRAKAWSNAAAMLGHWQIRGYGLWAVTLRGDDTAIGLVGPYYPDGRPETEIGWELFDGAEGHGYALEAARAAVKDCRERLGWTEIVHYIAPENTRSIALAERLGAYLDVDAPQPKPDFPCLVYRQPKPAEAL
ncbi:GNAT family N-acetyltransferase [Marinovum sp.]|uniref:GNAT family N-acetyltransferase n=1 Tax=Marinovum sp. TaxID=2024839 RepID=UPI003A8D1CA8